MKGLSAESNTFCEKHKDLRIFIVAIFSNQRNRPEIMEKYNFSLMAAQYYQLYLYSFRYF